VVQHRESIARRTARRLSLGLASCLCFAACNPLRAGDALRVSTGLISHNLCSEVFVAGLDPAQVYARSLAPRPGMSLIDWAVDYEVDPARRQVTTTLAGGFASRAMYRERQGCLLLRGGPDDESSSGALDGRDANDAHERIGAGSSLLPPIAGPEVVAPQSDALRAALDHAFAETTEPPHRWTSAVVVLHRGQVVAERYAPGYGVATPLLGYSATKSVISALIGILVRQGRLAPEGPAPIAAWSAPDDPRHAISIDQLLRMTSGLALDESGSPWCPVARMLYLERDMAGYAQSVALEAAPGSTWNYTSGNTILLSRLIRDAAIAQGSTALRFAHDELFAPLGMENVTLELDATATPVGSTYMLAPARDWARFGLLYLNDGVVGGRRLLPEGWVRASTTPTLDTGYGAGFWTNQVTGTIPWSPVPWGLPGAPRDAYFARGLLGQYVVVVPSAELVVARFGVSHEPDADSAVVGRLVAEVIAALEREAAPAAPGGEGP
jgi:CubicO group peptidase (beta-lactamase class C family)